MITFMAECDPHLKEVRFLSETSTLNVSFSNFSKLFDQTGSQNNFVENCRCSQQQMELGL